MADKKEKDTNAYEGAYSKIKKIRYVITTLLVVFVIFAIFSYREDLTVENFRYLMKYVDVKPVVFGKEGSAEIIFEPDSATVTSSFKEDLIVLTKSSVKIYDLTSTEIFSDDVALLNPAISVSDKYFAVYDVGKNNVTLYNSFSKLWEKNFSYPVYDVKVDGEGNYCIVTAEKNYASALKVYDGSFKNIFNWNSADKYALTADIYTDKKGTYACAGTVRSTDKGELLTELILLSTKSDKVLATHAFPSEMAVEVNYNSDGNVVFLTDKACRFYTREGKLLNEYPVSSKALRKFHSGEGQTVLVLNEAMVGKTHQLIIFDSKGNTYIEGVLDTEITDIASSDTHVFILGVEDVTVVDMETKRLRAYPTDRSYRSAEILDSKSVYLVYDGQASAMTVEE